MTAGGCGRILSMPASAARSSLFHFRQRRGRAITVPCRWATRRKFVAGCDELPRASWFVRTEACETLASKLCAPCVRAGILSQVGFSSSLIERPMDAVAMSALARGDYGHEGNAVGILDRYGTGRKTAMHGTERRMLATGALAEFDHGHADAIAELGCPTRVAPRAWRDERERAGEGDGGAWLSQESREALRVGRRVPAHGRRRHWVRVPGEVVP